MRRDIDKLEPESFDYHIQVTILAVFERKYALNQENVDEKLNKLIYFYRVNEEYMGHPY